MKGFLACLSVAQCVCVCVIYALHRPVTSPRLCIRLHFCAKTIDTRNETKRWFAWSESFYVFCNIRSLCVLCVCVCVRRVFFSVIFRFKKRDVFQATKKTPCFCIPNHLLLFNELLKWGVRERKRARMSQKVPLFCVYNGAIRWKEMPFTTFFSSDSIKLHRKLAEIFLFLQFRCAF